MSKSNMKGDIQFEHGQLLALLNEFKKVCEKYDIWYSLAYGSVLGAVRHNGFIPWDKDADVYILLPDRQRFRDFYSKDDHGDIVLKNCDTAPKCTQCHDTLRFNDKDNRMHLDIYVLVGAPTSFGERKRFAFWSYYLDRIFRSKHVSIRRCKRRNRFFVLASKIVTFFMSDKTIKKIIKKREQNTPYDSAEYLTDLGCDNKVKGCLRKHVLLDVYQHEFEGYMFNIPQRYEEYLTAIYGEDYMTPKKY